ncbi:fimbrial protein [Salmonella enterica subsp. enterica serovar Javiana]|nr:fimbrial protein [Salmonella enterica subsp. enterica serovar Javiana]
MVLNYSRVLMAGMLITVWAVACLPAAAKDTEKMQHLGVVNGQVKDNQVVEVTRTLTDPVLYKTETPDALPQVLRIRNATARAGDNGTVWLTVNQGMPGTKQQSGTVTARTALWVDGKQVPVTFSQQGTDVLVSVPQATTPQQQVMLRSDTPVVLQVPATWRGPVDVVMEISGEM